jgi:prepilin-type N-terminal cleavage/methylation domain-containing protein
VLQRYRVMRSNDSGFTLVELLIVIVILGILTGIVVFAVGAFSDRGQSAACKSDKKTVEVAVEAYRAKTGNYPTSADPDPVVASNARFDKLLHPNPLDPNEKYLREPPSTGNGYTITISDNNGNVASVGC